MVRKWFLPCSASDGLQRNEDVDVGNQKHMQFALIPLNISIQLKIHGYFRLVACKMEFIISGYFHPVKRNSLLVVASRLIEVSKAFLWGLETDFVRLV